MEITALEPRFEDESGIIGVLEVEVVWQAVKVLAIERLLTPRPMHHLASA